MKKIYTLLFLLLPCTLHAYDSAFQPYIGIDAGLNIADYAYDIPNDKNYYTATINAGARIGGNFGVELYYSASSTTNAEYIYNYETIDHEIGYSAFGFDIYAYYGVAADFDFFTTFGIANYQVKNDYEYTNPFITDNAKDTEDSVTTRFGIGIMFTLPQDKVSLLAQYQYSPINTETISTISDFSVGFRYNF